MDDKQQKLASAREKWNQKRKELKEMKEAKEAQALKEAQEAQALKEAQEVQVEKEPVLDYEDKISTLVKEINELKKTKSRKLKKIEYYGSDDEKVLPEPQTPKVKQQELPRQEQPKKEQLKPKVEVKNFFGRFI